MLLIRQTAEQEHTLSLSLSLRMFVFAYVCVYGFAWLGVCDRGT